MFRRAFFWLLLLSTQAHADPMALPFFDQNELTPYWPPSRLKPARVTAFKAIDQHGSPIGEQDLKQGVSLVNFFFAACPQACPLMMHAVRKLQKALGPARSAVRIYSFSVKPQTDSPEALRAYAKALQIDGPSWKLLTGDRREIYRVGKDMFKADGSIGAQKSDDSFIHTQNIYLVDQKLTIRGIYDSQDPAAMNFLQKDIVRLFQQDLSN